jgi:DNA polymerase III epsilon subunit-like protein
MSERDRKIYVCDLETGGIFPETDGICSITLKEFGKDNVLNFFIKPKNGLRYLKEAFEVNGLNKDFLKRNGITEKEALKMIINFTKGEKFMILGHNTNFDYLFLKALFERHGYNINDFISYRLRDTQVIGLFMSDCGLESYESFSLGNMHEITFGNKIRHAHSSLGDVLATELLYKHFVDKIERLRGK